MNLRKDHNRFRVDSVSYKHTVVHRSQTAERKRGSKETRASRRVQRTVERLVSGTGHLTSWFKAIRPLIERSTSRSPGRTHDRVTRESTGRPVAAL